MECYRTHYKKCVVPGCKDLFSKRHSFPTKDIVLFDKWVDQVQNPILKNKTRDQIYKCYRVCHLHFSEYDRVPGTKRGLRKTAFPTELLPQSGVSTSPSTTSTPPTTTTLIKEEEDPVPNPVAKGAVMLQTLLSNSSNLKSISGRARTLKNSVTTSPLTTALIKEEGDPVSNRIAKGAAKLQTNRNNSKSISGKTRTLKDSYPSPYTTVYIKEDDFPDSDLEEDVIMSQTLSSCSPTFISEGALTVESTVEISQFDYMPCTEGVDGAAMALAERLLGQSTPSGYHLIEYYPVTQTGTDPHRWVCHFERVDNVYRHDYNYISHVKTAFEKNCPLGCGISQVAVSDAPNRRFVSVEFLVNCGCSKISKEDILI